MRSLPSPLREPSHTVPSLLVPVDRGRTPQFSGAEPEPPCPGSARPQVALSASSLLVLPARLTCLRVAHLGTPGQAEKEAQHLQSRLHGEGRVKGAQPSLARGPLD